MDMRIKAIIAAILAMLLLSGCSYAPGFAGLSFWEMPVSVPDLPIEEYHSSNVLAAEDKVRDPIPDPKVDLDDLPVRQDSDIVRVRDYIPDILVDLRYATSDNFTQKTVYEFTDLYLRYGTVVKLMQAQQELRTQGVRLKVWDGFRPVSAQNDLWAAYPNPVYVENPETGYSHHSYGGSIDVTLVDVQGYELTMPSKFDDFTSKADRDFSDCTELASQNATLLQTVMEKYGFVADEKEWWHFTDENEFPLDDCFDPAVISQWYAVCNEYINIRSAADVNAESIGKVPANARFTLLGWSGRFAFIEFQGLRGYVNADYIDEV